MLMKDEQIFFSLLSVGKIKIAYSLLTMTGNQLLCVQFCSEGRSMTPLKKPPRPRNILVDMFPNFVT